MSGFITKVTGMVAKFGAKAAKHSPELFMAGGFALGGTGIFLACKSTLKASEVIENHKANMNEIREAAELCGDEYSERDKRRDTTLVCVKTTGEFIKLYFPAFVCEIGAAACFLAAFGILKRRNAVLTAAYAELLKKYNSYRGRVIEKYGEDADREILASGRSKEVEVDKDGNVISEKETVATDCSQYARFFDSSCPAWEKSPEYNITFIKNVQEMLTTRLHAKGHVFLNEAYDALGFERTSAGAVVGWLDKGDGDGFIDFGIIDCTKKANRRFVNGLENVILLDFNVDGVIYDKI